MKTVVHYKVSTGEIQQVTHTIWPDLVQKGENQELLQIDGQQAITNMQYVDTSKKQVFDRPEMPVVVSGTTLKVPANTEFVVNGAAELTGQADETGILEFEFDEPGEYVIRLINFPYMDKEVIIRAD